MTDNAKNIVDHALEYERRGLLVLPCNPANKQPFTVRGLDSATANPGLISRWWQQWPQAMIGVRMGADSGVWALDPDLPDEPDKPNGLDNWQSLIEKHGGCPATHSHATPRGGRHLLFKWRADRPVTNSPGQLKDLGIDVKGERGYVIVPPSVRHDGKAYEHTDPEHAFQFADAPDWLYDLLKKPEPARPWLASSQPSPPSRVTSRPWARAALDGELEVLAATSSGRNEALNRAAFKLGQLVGGGELSESEAKDTLYETSVANGYVEKDGRRAALASINSGLRAGEQKPRSAPEREGRDGKQETGPLPLICAAELHGKPIVDQQWHVPGLIPQKQVTALYGDGATGKSLLALMLAVATAMGLSWIGFEEINCGPVIYLGAEDDIEELHRRLAQIVLSLGVSLTEAHDLHLVPLAGEDAVLATFNEKKMIETTKRWEQLRALVKRIRPTLLILDTKADLFGGNELDRVQARQFIGLLRGLAISTPVSVVLLDHPSLTGMSSGTGASGSTGWSNSVRSRLYLERVIVIEKTEAGAFQRTELDETLRELSNKKANYSAKGAPIRLKWEDGVFVRQVSAFGLDTADRDSTAELTFMKLLRLTERQGVRVNAKSSTSYAPTVFARRTDAEGITKRAFAGAMERLLNKGQIRIEHEGPPSRRVSYLTANAPEDDQNDGTGGE
jgi:RecA-family ATPase